MEEKRVGKDRYDFVEREKTYTDVDDYREECIEISKELGYPDSVRRRLERAKSQNEIIRIMRTARKTHM